MASLDELVDTEVCNEVEIESSWRNVSLKRAAIVSVLNLNFRSVSFDLCADG